MLLVLAPDLVGSRNPAAWLTFIGLSAIGMFTVPVMLYPLGIVAGWIALAILARKKSWRVRWLDLLELIKASIAAGAVTLILYTPVLVISGVNALIANPYVRAKGWVEFFDQLPAFLGAVLGMITRDVPLPASIVLAGGVGFALISHPRLSRYRVPLVLPAVLWCGILLVAQRATPFERTWLFVVPLTLIIAAAGISGAISIMVKRIGPRTGESALIPVIGYVTTVLIGLGMGGSVIGNRSILAYGPAEYPQAAHVTTFLKENFQGVEMTTIYARLPTRAATTYYFEQLGGERTRFIDDPVAQLADGKAVVVLVATNFETVDKILPRTYPDGTPIQPRLVMSDGTAQVYVIDARR